MLMVFWGKMRVYIHFCIEHLSTSTFIGSNFAISQFFSFFAKIDSHKYWLKKEKYWRKKRLEKLNQSKIFPKHRSTYFDYFFMANLDPDVY